jgi:hypothetical protein
MLIFIERSEAVSKALRARRIEPVQGDVVDIADEVADEFKGRFTRPLQDRKATQSDEQGSS